MPTYTTTVKHLLRRLTGSNLVSDVDAGFTALSDDIDSKLTPYDAGALASRPVSTAGSPGKTGRWYRATDTGQLFIDHGTGWVEVTLLAADRSLALVGDLYGASYVRSGDGTTSAVIIGFDPTVAGSGPAIAFGLAYDTLLRRVAANALATPGSLSVRGRDVPTATEVGLKTIRGTVTNVGSVSAGTGFTVVKNATGDYTITYAVPFSAVASVVACANASAGIWASYIASTATSVDVRVSNGAGSAVDAGFAFIATGPG